MDTHIYKLLSQEISHTRLFVWRNRVWSKHSSSKILWNFSMRTVVQRNCI